MKKMWDSRKRVFCFALLLALLTLPASILYMRSVPPAPPQNPPLPDTAAINPPPIPPAQPDLPPVPAAAIVTTPTITADSPALSPTNTASSSSPTASAALLSPAITESSPFFQHTPDVQLLESREGPADASGHWRRELLVKASGKYPFVRLDQELAGGIGGNTQLISEKAWVADHVLVVLRSDRTRADLENTLQGSGWTIRRAMYAPNHFLVAADQVDLDTAARGAEQFNRLTNLVNNTGFDFVVYTADVVPNDPRFSELWGLRNTGETGGTAGADISAVKAWEMTTGSSNVIVSVIDTGTDYNHPDLKDNMWINTGEIPDNNEDDDLNGFIDDVHGWDFCNDDHDPFDDHYHGTHCAGTIGAVGDNMIGVVGVCWRVRIMPLKFLSASGSGYSSDAVDCVHYAVNNGSRVLSNSWGGGGALPALVDAIGYAQASNVLFVAAAGNDGKNTDDSVNYPSCYTNENILAVAALDYKDKLASFSNYGKTTVDVGAPGVNILSTYPTANVNGPYHAISGTSMATPHVAGLAALLLARENLPVLLLKSTIMNSCDPVESVKNKVVSNGRINALQALQYNASAFLDKSSYFYNEYLTATIRDQLAIGSNHVKTLVTTDRGDAELLTLYPRVGDTRYFTNRLLIVQNAAPISNNGQLDVQEGDTLTLLYTNVTGEITATAQAGVSLNLEITLDEADILLSNNTFSTDLCGENNGNVPVTVIISNETSGAVYTFSTTNRWCFTVPLTDYVSIFHITGSNAYGRTAEQTCVISRKGPAGTNYVSTTGSHEWPFSSPGTAATNLMFAVRAASAGNTVLIDNGEYEIQSAVLVTLPITLRSENGPESTLIRQTSKQRCITVTASNTVLDGLCFSGGDSDFGGAVYCQGNALLTNCILRDSKGVFGGGLYASGQVVAANCRIENNASFMGGGFYAEQSVSLQGCTIQSNTATEKGGGGFMSGAAHITGCLVVTNRAECGGGGLFLTESASASACTLENNVAILYGGGVSMQGSVVVSNCTLRANSVKTYSISSSINGGGGAYLFGGLLTHSTVITNRTCMYGGGILQYAEEAGNHSGGTVRNCLIRDNTSSLGGGVMLYDGGLFENNLVTGNSSEFLYGYYYYEMSGGGMFICTRHTNNNLIVRNSTITRNTGIHTAGGLSAFDDTKKIALFQNCIIQDNCAPASQNYRIANDSGIICSRFSHTFATPLIEGTNNMSGDPCFRNPAAADFRLSAASPCIDQGMFYTGQGAQTDLEGNPRIYGRGPDIGAYEFTPNGLTCAFRMEPAAQGAEPFSPVFTAFSTGGQTNADYYIWDLNGDGLTDLEGYGLSSVTGLYSHAGQYTVSLTVSNALGETALFVLTNGISVGYANLYVATNGLHQAPYTNWTMAATNVQTALNAASDGASVWVGNGTYTYSGTIQITNGIDVRSLSGSTGTVLRAAGGYRVVTLSHPDALLEGFSLENGQCSSYGQRGAGAMIQDGGTIRYCTISGNRSLTDSQGGGVYVFRGGLVENCIIQSNTTVNYAGGAYLLGAGPTGPSTIRNSLLIHNTAGSEGGPCCGGMYLDQGAQAINCTIVSNLGTKAGAGIGVGSDSLVKNCIAWYNGKPEISDRDIGISPYLRDAVLENNCVGSFATNATIGNMITNEPLFTDMARGGYTLLPGSPCLNAGVNESWMNDTLDLADSPRIAYGTVDIGAYEMQEALNAQITLNQHKGFSPLSVTATAWVGGTNVNGLSYAWDMNGDGTNDFEGPDASTVTNLYTEAGIYSVTLTVSNEAGETATAILKDFVQVQTFSCFEFSGFSSIQTAGVPFKVTLTARGPTNEVLTAFSEAVALSLPGFETPALTPTDILFTNGRCSASLTIDGTASNLHLLADDGAGHASTSFLFSVVLGPLHHFAFQPLALPLSPEVPFAVNIRACDPQGYTYTPFTNAIQLYAGVFGAFGTYIELLNQQAYLNYPINPALPSRRMQCIYTTNQVGKAGRINGLALYVSPFAQEMPLSDFRIRMMHTPLNAYPASNNIWESSGWQVVYDNTKLFSSTGWAHVTFDTSFEYNGTNSLMIDFAYYNEDLSEYNAYVTASTMPSNQSLFYGTANDYGHPADWPTNDYNPKPSPSVYVPDIRLFYESDISSVITPTSTTAFAGGEWSGNVRIGSLLTNAQLVADDGEGHKGYSEIFNVGVAELQVKSALGTAIPPVGFHYYSTDTVITCRVEEAELTFGATQYVCAGWSGEGAIASNPVGGGNAGAITLSDNASITWLWTTNYRLDLSASHGTLTQSSGWYEAGSTVVVETVANPGAEFWYWKGQTNGCFMNGTRIEIPMTNSRTIEALFTRGYYVNDASISNDAWCSAPGDDANDGTSASRPKATVQSVLTNYTLTPGDVLRIDTGIYTPTSTIWVAQSNSGSALSPVIIETSPYGVHFTANSADMATNAMWRLEFPIHLTLRMAEDDPHPEFPRQLPQISGAQIGVYVRHCSYVTLSGWEIFSNTQHGVLNAGSDSCSFSHVLLHHNNEWGLMGTNYTDEIRIENCTLADNALGAIHFSGGSIRNMRNNILCSSGNSRLIQASELSYFYSDYNCYYSTASIPWVINSNNYVNLLNLRNSMGCDTNSFSTDPYFAKTGTGGYQLQSMSGHFEGKSLIIDSNQSSCIDAGDPAFGFAAEREPNGSRINMGVYGATPLASLSPTGLVWRLDIESIVGESGPSVGPHYYYDGTDVTITQKVTTDLVNQVSSYTLAGWVLSNATDQAGMTNGTNAVIHLRLTNHTQAVWTWNARHLLRITTNGPGIIPPVGGWYDEGTVVPVCATARMYAGFTQWKGQTNECTTSGSNLLATMKVPHSITGVFAALTGHELARFDVSYVPSPQQVNQGVPVTITALSASGLLAPFNETVSLSQNLNPVITNMSNYSSSYSAWYPGKRGIRVLVTNEITVTHIRHKGDGATAAFIWSDNGTVLRAAYDIASTNAYDWVIRPVTPPLRLTNGQICRIGISYPDYTFVYSKSSPGFPISFADGIITSSCGTTYGSYPSTINTNTLIPVDVLYVRGALITPSPSVLGPFTNGSWSGNIVISNPVTELLLKVNDEGDNHAGLFNLFDVAAKWILRITSRVNYCSPEPGAYEMEFGSMVTTRVDSPIISGGTQYVCTGWTSSGNGPLSGSNTECVLTLTNNTELIWLWNTNYYVEITAGSHGSVSTSGGWVLQGSTTTVAAIPYAYYHFNQWSGASSGTDNPLRITVFGPITLSALFAENRTSNNPTPEWWMVQFGWTNDFEAASESDQDGDGVPTWQEWVADTDPSSSNSYFHIRLPHSFTQPALTIPYSPDRTYQVQRRYSLSAEWTPLSPEEQTLDPKTGTITCVETSSLHRCYYRISVSEP